MLRRDSFETHFNQNLNLQTVRLPWQSGLALLFYTLVSGVMLYPLLLNFSGKLPAFGGDIYEYVWKLWWFKHSLVETGQSPWVVPDIYYPFGYLLAYGEITAANTILALPLTLALGEVTTFNLLVWLSTILSGFTMFLLGREVTGSYWAGLLAGLIYAFSPFRYPQMSHLNILTTQWLPLIFYFLERFGRTRKPVYGLAAGLAFGLNALASWYYAVAGALFGLLWVLFRFRPLKSYVSQKQTWQALGLFSAAAGALILPFARPYLAILGNPDVAIPMENCNFFSASLVEYILPSPFHFLWGQWVQQHLFNRPAPGEFIIGWGFVTWLFGLYGLRFASRRVVKPWLVVVLVAVILSFGLTLHLGGRQIVLPAPPPVVDRVNDLFNRISLNYALDAQPFTIGREDGLVIPMPALLLRWFVPVLGKIRTWTRFGFIAVFGMAILAGLGAAAWHRREIKPNRSATAGRLAWLIVITVALFELWWRPVPMMAPVFERPVDQWLHSQPGDQPIIEYPLGSAFDGQQLVYTRAHGKPILHGYATYFSFAFSRQHPELLDFPDPPALQKLTDLGARFVLVETARPYTKEANAILADIDQNSCLQQRTVQGTVYVFELVGCE